MILDLGGGVSYVSGGYYGSVWGGGVVISEAPPAPPPVAVGGGYFPALVKPQGHRYVAVVSLGRLRVGGRVVYFRNLAIEEEENLFLILDLL